MTYFDYIGMCGICADYDINDKPINAKKYIAYMLARSLQMFSYKGLPDTIPQRSLELFLQCNGYTVWTNKYNGKDWFIYHASLGGEPDQLYMPTRAIIANPAQTYSADLKIGEECVVMRNDSMYMGLLHEYAKYAYLLAENDISMRCADIWARLPVLISASDDRTKVSADKVIDDLVSGKLSTVGEAPVFDGLKVQGSENARSAAVLTDLIEYHQYLKAGWFNFIGLNSNYNMKREAINSNEAQMDNDALLPLVDDMLQQRREALAKIEEMGGPHIEVELSSSWLDRQQEEELEHEIMEAEADTNEEEVREDDGETEDAVGSDSDVDE